MKSKSLLLFFLFISLIACDSSRWEIPDEKKVIDQTWKRFDLSIASQGEKLISQSFVDSLEDEFPRFFPLYTEAIMRFGALDKAETKQTLKQFLNDDDIAALLKEIERFYPEGSLNTEMKELSDGFSALAYYFPGAQIPEVVTYSSALTYATVTDDSLLGIGLDMYLGKDYPIYPQAGIPLYKFSHFEREYMVSDAMRAWIITEFNQSGGNNLLQQMIYQGKISYLLHALFPNKPKHILMNYTQQEYDWCAANEEDIWFHFVDMEILYTLENHIIRKYLGEAPFVAGFPEGSPGRVAQWVGFQIVEAYMENNPKITLPQLMQQENADLILQQSKYKPRR